jgi:hypothetical protein
MTRHQHQGLGAWGFGLEITRVIVSALLLGLIAVSDGAAQPAPDREIVQLKGDLYRVRVGDQHTVFLVTTAGIVLVDPISVETVQWLKEEFEHRFKPGVVRFVLHTNHRFDRAEGASIFLAPAELIGHREFNGELSAARRAGAASIAVSDRARARDRNGDGRVTSEELYVRVRDVESQFNEKRVITLGGRTIEMVHAEARNAPDNAIINFPSERTAFASDAPPLDEPAFQFGDWTPAEVKRWLAAASSLQFDNLVLENGHSIPRARITRLSSYVNDLVARVVQEYEAGRSADEFTEAKLPAAYRSDAAFREWRGNVSDVFESLSVFRVDATLGGLGHYAIRDSAYCASFTSCSTGGMVPAATGSLSVGAGRWAGVAEFSVSDESFTAHTSRLVDEDFALVETRTSFMFRYTRPAGNTAFRFLGGLSYTIGDRQGITRVKEALPPLAGRHPLESHRTRWGYTGGLDLVIGRSFGIVVPLRFNYAREDPSGTFPHRMDAQAGIALTLRLFRSVD